MGVFRSPLGRLSRDYCGWDSLLGQVSGGISTTLQASYTPLCCWLGGGCFYQGKHPRSLSLYNYLAAIACCAQLLLLICVSPYRSYNLVQLGLSYPSSFKVYLEGLICHPLLYFIFFTAVYASSSFVLGALLYLIYVYAPPVSFLSPICTLGVALLLAFKALPYLNCVVVQLGFIPEAIYDYSFIYYFRLHLLSRQVNYQSTTYFNPLEPW